MLPILHHRFIKTRNIRVRKPIIRQMFGQIRKKARRTIYRVNRKNHMRLLPIKTFRQLHGFTRPILRKRELIKHRRLLPPRIQPPQPEKPIWETLLTKNFADIQAFYKNKFALDDKPLDLFDKTLRMTIIHTYILKK